MTQVRDDERSDVAARRGESVKTEGAHELHLGIGGMPEIPSRNSDGT